MSPIRCLVGRAVKLLPRGHEAPRHGTRRNPQMRRCACYTLIPAARRFFRRRRVTGHHSGNANEAGLPCPAIAWPRTPVGAERQLLGSMLWLRIPSGCGSPEPQKPLHHGQLLLKAHSHTPAFEALVLTGTSTGGLTRQRVCFPD